MAFYEGIDEEIYEGGDHYVPMQRFRLNQNYTPNSVTPDMTAGGGISTLYPYSGSANYNDKYRGGGKWGNLDLSKTKTFMKDVWTETGGVGAYDWVPTPVKGFYNPQLGNWQTYDGKNINHGGIDIEPTIVSIGKNILGYDDSYLDDSGGRIPGSIKGTFTDGLSSGIDNIKEGWEEEKDKWGGLLGIDKAKSFFKNKKENQWADITDIDSQDNQPGGSPIINNTSQGDGGDQGKDSWGGHGSVEAYDKSQADTYARAKDMHNYADGGRIYLNLGGLASMLGREGFKKGGRQDRMGGTMEQTTQELREVAPDQFGGGMNISHGGGDNQNNNALVPKTNYIDIKSDLMRKDPFVNLSVMSPLEIAQLQATMGYRDFLDNDDLSVEGDITTNIGPVNTTTDFTEEGVGNTDINWGNFSTTIDPNKNIQNIGYNNSWNGIDYGVNTNLDNTMFTAGINFKNGGLVSIL